MTLATEAVTLAGSGLVFINSYESDVTPAYRTAILAAEDFLESHFTNSLTISVDFNLESLGAQNSAQNQFDTVTVGYATFAAALRAHATTSDDVLAVNGLPTTDPSHGAGFALPTAYAVMLGLAPQSNEIDDTVTLNSDLHFTFGQDAIGAIEHEITEGSFGRISSLGFDGAQWNPLDLFRFSASGQRDFTGGSDGVETFFGIDSNHVSALAFHNAINAAGMNDGEDLGDWDHTIGDAFGPGGPGSPGTVSVTDLQVLDILGWNPTNAAAPFIAPPDDFASSLTDTSHPFGQIAVGGSAIGALQQAGDHDWFAVQLQAGDIYTISETGHTGGGGTLADPFLQLHDANGNVVASNDDIVDGTDPDSRIVFEATTSGTFYVDAGAFVDGYAGSYTVSVAQTGGSATAPTGEMLMGSAGDNTVVGAAGDDTITGGGLGAGSSYLRGGPGNDVITGGPAFNDMNGNMGNDTVTGGSGDNWVVGGQGDDQLFGGGGVNVIYGNLGADTLHGGANGDIMRGGQGDDSIIGGQGNDYISGDLGNDTETGGGGADLFHGSQNIGIDRVLDFNYAQGDRVELDPGTIFTLSQAGADTVIDMGNGNEMILSDVTLANLPSDWIFEGTLAHL